MIESSASPTVRDLSRKELGPVAQMMFRAFLEDPAWALVFDDPATRDLVYARMWPAVAKYAFRWGETRVVDGPAGVACWLRPGATKVTAIRGLIAGYWKTMTPLDANKREEFMLLLNELDEVHELLVPEPHWYLSSLAVDPERQGEGIGSALLQDGMEMASRSGDPIYLESITEPNTAYYEHRGFELIRSGTIEPSGFPYWCMVWRP